MNRLIAFAGVVVVAITVLPSVCLPLSGESCAAFVAENARGGVTCYHANDQSCPYIEPHSCDEVRCTFFILNEEVFWVCKGRGEDGSFIPVIISVPHDSSYVECLEDQEPGYKEKKWGGTIYCRQRRECSGCKQYTAESVRRYCASFDWTQLTDAHDTWSLEGNCWDE